MPHPMTKHVAMEQVSDIGTGLPAEVRQPIAEGLARVLADTYVLYLKTHAYHWNVTGPLFSTLHRVFEEQYQALWQSVDEIAERLRAIGAVAPGTGAAFTRLSSVEDDDGDEVPAAEAMLQNLVDGHGAAIGTIRGLFGLVQEHEDEATKDLLIRRLAFHEKTTWMLRSLRA